MTREEVVVSNEDFLLQKSFVEGVLVINKQHQILNGRIKYYYIETFGCQMNENDSEKISGMLEQMGYISTNDVKKSDVVVFNTCCVRENAEEKVYGHLGALKNLKKEKKDMTIVLCGCMTQQDEVVGIIKKKYRHVDIVFGTHNIYKFPEYLLMHLSEGKAIVDVDDSDGTIVEGIPVSRKDGIKAWVSIMFGCNNFCSYCIVPYVRGRERSRNKEAIIRELEDLAACGYKEITLLGQNVNSYGMDKDEHISFAMLLDECAKIEGIERIRFMTSHPKDLSDELIDVISRNKKLCNHIHLPLQSGSSKVLKAMNRHYTKEDFLSLVGKIRAKLTDVAITTDIIVGFPGETKEDFDDTLDVVRQSKFDMAYTFLYSKRTGTPAAKIEEQVPEDEKSKRFQELLQLQNSISREINEDFDGKVVEVLVEGKSEKNDTVLSGRTDGNKIVNFEADKALVGSVVKVKIDIVQTWSLGGKVQN